MDKVGRFEILEELGRGAAGVVYKAHDPAIGRLLAVKRIALQDLRGEEAERARERLLREAQSAGILSHPCIVTIYDVAEQSGFAYIFMELVKGPPLDRMLRDGKTVDRQTLLGYLRQAASALDYAHKKGVIHRDIKPGNILIQEDGTVKITDFGVAKIVSRPMTRVGAMMGTPSYMSPEQIQGSAITGRADQFALAAVAYEALSGRKAFTAENIPALLSKIGSEDPASWPQLEMSFGPAVDAVLRKAFSKEPGDRYASCADFVHALDDAFAAPVSVLAPAAPAMPRDVAESAVEIGEENRIGPLVRKSYAVWLPAGIGIAALIFVVLIFASRGRSRTVPEKPPQAAVPPASPLHAATPEPAAETTSAKEDSTKAPAAARTAAPRTSGPVDFQVTTNPTGGVAVFDGDSSLSCTAPCTIALAAGRHAFVVHHAGYRDGRRIIEVPRDKQSSIDLQRMTGALSLSTTPPGLSIIVDGQEQEKKTPAMIYLSAGTHHVQVIKGSERQEFDVEIADDSLVSKTLEWVK